MSSEEWLNKVESECSCTRWSQVRGEKGTLGLVVGKVLRLPHSWLLIRPAPFYQMYDFLCVTRPNRSWEARVTLLNFLNSSRKMAQPFLLWVPRKRDFPVKLPFTHLSKNWMANKGLSPQGILNNPQTDVVREFREVRAILKSKWTDCGMSKTVEIFTVAQKTHTCSTTHDKDRRSAVTHYWTFCHKHRSNFYFLPQWEPFPCICTTKCQLFSWELFLWH